MPLDAELSAFAHSPVRLGAKTVHISEHCVARYLQRQRAGVPEHAEFARLTLRQRLETGRFRRSEPPSFPEELHGRWQGFIDAGGLIFCLNELASGSFQAVSCFEAECLSWKVCCAEQHERLARSQVIVETPNHVVERYLERVHWSLSVAHARHELQELLSEHARLLPELPRWFVGEGRDDSPYVLVAAGWLVVPLRFKEHSSFRYVATTCLGHGLCQAHNERLRREREREQRGQREHHDQVVFIDQQGASRRKRHATHLHHQLRAQELLHRDGWSAASADEEL